MVLLVNIDGTYVNHIAGKPSGLYRHTYTEAALEIRTSCQLTPLDVAHVAVVLLVFQNTTKNGFLFFLGNARICLSVCSLNCSLFHNLDWISGCKY